MMGTSFTRAQEAKIHDMFCPKLTQFLSEYPTASEWLQKLMDKSFAARQLRIYYYYSNDQSLANSFHYYPDTNSVVIIVRENNQPIDEFIFLAYEALNSENQPPVEALWRKAQMGTIAREEFAREVLMLEFKAEKKFQALFGSLKIPTNETAKSIHYNQLMGCPDTFEEFISYTKKISAPKDPLEEYEIQYDAVRGQTSTNK
jgi:hypothetical protein